MTPYLRVTFLAFSLLAHMQETVLPVDILTAVGNDIPVIKPLFQALSDQDVFPQRIVVLLYAVKSYEDHQHYEKTMRAWLDPSLHQSLVIVSSFTSDHEQWNYHGYDRQFLLECAMSPWVFFIDSDNSFAPNFLRIMQHTYQDIADQYQRPCILSPSIYYAQTQTLQSQWISSFFRWFPKYQYNTLTDQQYAPVQMIGWNSLFGPTALFRTISFDRRFAYCYEDVDYTFGLYRAWFPVIVLRDIHIFHHDTRQSPLQKRFLHTPQATRYRARNRIIFAKKHAHGRASVAYFGLGFWLQTCLFVVLILYYKRRQPRTMLSLLTALVRGTRAGLRA